MPKAPSIESNNYQTGLIREYCYTVQLFKDESDPQPSWAGTYGAGAAIVREGKMGDGVAVSKGLGREGRITGGSLNASSEAHAIEQLTVLYGTLNASWRLLSLEPRGVVGLGNTG